MYNHLNFKSKRMEIATKEVRTINADIMESVMKFAPQDGFKLADDILNTIWKVIDVDETEFGKNKSFIVTLQNEDGRIINLSAAALKKARVLGKTDAKGGTAYKNNDNIFIRSEAEEFWNGSTYFHATGTGMKKDAKFVLPEKIHLKYAVLTENPEDGKPALNPFLYKGFRNVVTAYADSDTFPSMDDFREELLKSKEDGRISSLPLTLTEPTPQNWVKDEVSNYRHTLIIEDIKD